MRKFTFLFMAVFICFTFTSFAQVDLPESNWEFVDVFPDETTHAWTNHGLAVDDDSKVWAVPYSIYYDWDEEVDTLRKNPLFVFNEDGTQADFSPIFGYEIDEDMQYFGRFTGLNRDHEGNILVAVHGTRDVEEDGAWDGSTAWLYRINAETGELMDHLDITYMRTETAAHAPNRPSVTEDGHIFISMVFGGSPIIIFDEDFVEVQTVTEDKGGFSRSLEVSPDGNYIYQPGFSQNYITVYHSEFGVLGDYEVVDTTLAEGMQPGAISLDPTDSNVLWVTAAGGGNDPLPEESPYHNHSDKIFAIDLETSEIVDYVEWGSDEFEIPRAIAFTQDGETLYSGTFSQGVPAVRKYEKVEDIPEIVLPDSDWEFVDVFPDSVSATRSSNGVVMDAEGKVWIMPYFGTRASEDPEMWRTDLLIFDGDGNEVDFSPIRGYHIDELGDSLRFGWGTGLNVDHEGNILVTIHGTREETGAHAAVNTSTSWLIRINSETGELMDYLDFGIMREEDVARSPNRPAVTDDGYIVISFVFGGSPIIIYDEDFNEVTTVTEEKVGFSRSLEVSPDGSYIYNPAYSLGVVRVLYGEFGVLGDYEVVDTTLAQHLVPGAIALDPTDDNILWVSATGANWAALAEDNPYYNHSNKVFAFDVTTNEIVDYVDWAHPDRPEIRGIGFSNDGGTMYLGTNFAGVPAVQAFSRVVSVRPTDRAITDGFHLSQNYPNPFNPSTTIQFSLPTQTDVRLEVFNTLGQRVKTLIANEVFSAGTYTVEWHGVNEHNRTVPSGMYIYRITAGEFVESKRMMFLK